MKARVGGTRGMHFASHQDFDLVPKTDTAITRKALEASSYLCECCKDGENLRVCSRGGDLVVLCSGCRITQGFRLVIKKRRSQISKAL